MSKRSVFTTVTPLPAGISRQTVMETLQSHVEMIDLNPLVEERHPIKPPAHATAEEYHCLWYSLTDRVQYLPGGLASGKVSYTCCFHDLENGLQTHCYAPMGLNIKGKWTIGGSLPGEPVAPVELGAGVPLHGLWLREDVDMKCNIMMTSFVKKTLKKSHSALVERLVVKAQIADARMKRAPFIERVLSAPESITSQLSTPQLSTSQLSSSQMSTPQSTSQTPTAYSPSSEYDDDSLYPDSALTSPVYATFGMQNKNYPPLTLQNPQLQISQVHPALRPGPPRQPEVEWDEKPTQPVYNPSLYAPPTNPRRASAQSWHESIHGSSPSHTSFQASADSIQNDASRARIASWQNTSAPNVRNPARPLDPGFQGSHYRSASSQSAFREAPRMQDRREMDSRGNGSRGQEQRRERMSPPPAYRQNYSAELEG
ncbi:Nacht and wd40 domain protein [Rutstroemia sp. NJR-2017a WRK4]|nr:Nacht and wd40 domain protein [Rutstroemia sp. NJR-2017a WRK4]